MLAPHVLDLQRQAGNAAVSGLLALDGKALAVERTGAEPTVGGSAGLLSASSLLHLQRAAGNASVNALLAQDKAPQRQSTQAGVAAGLVDERMSLDRPASWPVSAQGPVRTQRSVGNGGVSGLLIQRSPTAAVETLEQALALVGPTLERFQQAVDTTDESVVRRVGTEVGSVWQRVELARLNQPRDSVTGAADEPYDRARRAVISAISTQRYHGENVDGSIIVTNWVGALSDFINDQVAQTAWVVKDADAAVHQLQQDEPLSEQSGWTVVGLLRQHPNPSHFAFMLAVIRRAGLEARLTRLPDGPRAALDQLRANQPALRAIPGLAPGGPIAKLALAPEENAVQLVQPLSPVEVATELYGAENGWRDVLMPLNRTVLAGASDGAWLSAGTRLFVSPEILKPVYRIVFLAAATARRRAENANARPVIRATPDGPLVPGNTIKLWVDWPNAAFAATPIEWSVENDPAAVAAGEVPAKVQGHKGTLSWGGKSVGTSFEVEAHAVGNHVVHCKVSPSNGREEDVTRTLIVMTSEERVNLQQKANSEFDRSPADLLQDLKKRRDETTDAASKAEIQKRIEGIEGVLKDEMAINMRPLRGSYVSSDKATASISLRIFADIDRSVPQGGSTVSLKLWDLTLNGLPRNYKASGGSAAEALRNLVTTFADDAPYPKGKVRVAIPQTALSFPDVQAATVDAPTDGGMLIDDVLRGASMLALGVGLVAAAVGQAEVAIPAFVISGVLAGEAAAFEIGDRLEHGDFEWDLQTAMNLLDIAGALLTLGMVGGATATARGVGRLRVIGQLNKAVGVTQIAVQAGVHLAAIAAAVESGDSERIVNALSQAIAAGALFLIIHKASAKLGGSTDEALSKAAGTRTATGGLDPEGFAKLMNSLPDVPIDSAALRAFAGESVGLSSARIKLVPIGGGIAGEGVSGAPVYLIHDADGQVVGALKIFPKAEEFVRELSALEKLGTLQLTLGKGVSARGVARTGIGGRQGGILVSSAAEGQALNRMMAKVAQASGPARERAFMDLRSAVVANARALSRLHSAVPGGEVSTAYIQRYVNEGLDITTKLEAKGDLLAKVGFDTAAMRPKVNELINGFREHPGGSSFVHGDAHPGNFFYDPATGITMIDTPTMHYSIDANGNPIGAAGRDVGNFAQKLAHFGKQFGLQTSEIGELQSAFQANYKEAGGGRSTIQADAFFRARAALGELLKTVNETGGTEEALRNQGDLARDALGLPAIHGH